MPPSTGQSCPVCTTDPWSRGESLTHFVSHLFDTSDYPDRWHCGQWSLPVGVLHIASDLMIFLAYAAIPLTLAYFVLRRRDVPFTWMMWLFAAFILLCGTGHLLDACVFWFPAYRFLGVWKLITGIVSAVTAVVLIRLVPTAIELPGLARVNDQLRNEIQQRTAVETELRHLALMADQSNRAKDQFLANMSHEIRTPMTAILGFTDILASETTDRDSMEMIDVIQRNARHLLTIINDLLDLSKIEAGKLELRPEPVRPRQLVEDTLTSLRGKAEMKGLKLSAEFDGQVPDAISTDPTRLRQILVNLVGNAIKFTDAGSVHVRVRLENTSSATPLLAVDVIDTGIGIPVELQSQLFQPFQQVDGSMSRRHGGTGLGLSICRRLAEMLGGSIGVESVPDRGSRFTFRIAANSGTGGSSPRPSSARSPEVLRAEPVSAGPSLGLRVLAVDDGIDNQRLIAYMLRRVGVVLETAVNGEDALLRASESLRAGQPFDLILMDMQMPIKDGFTATRELRAQGWRRPIVALTALAMSGDRERCLEAGCDDVIAKPFRSDDLVGTVERVCRNAKNPSPALLPA
jgi:signal transduction histidine kinase/ActR/RegA family two-component response regulator